MIGLSQQFLELMSQGLGRWKHVILRTIFDVPFDLSTINSIVSSCLKKVAYRVQDGGSKFLSDPVSSPSNL